MIRSQLFGLLQPLFSSFHCFLLCTSSVEVGLRSPAEITAVSPRPMSEQPHCVDSLVGWGLEAGGPRVGLSSHGSASAGAPSPPNSGVATI